MAKADHAQLQITRLIPAPPERVFEAWTDPEQLKCWWGPARVRCIAAKVDLRVGGEYEIINELEDATQIRISGHYEVVDKPKLLIYSWGIGNQSSRRERVTVHFEPHEQGTELTLRHERISSLVLQQQHRQGWHGCLAGLVDYVCG